MALYRQDLPFAMMQMTETYMGHQGGQDPSGEGSLLDLHDLEKASHSSGLSQLFVTMSC